MVSVNNNFGNISPKLPRMVVGAFKDAGFSNSKVPLADNLSNSNGTIFDLSDEALKLIGLNEDIHTLGILSKANKQEREVQKFANYYI